MHRIRARGLADASRASRAHGAMAGGDDTGGRHGIVLIVVSASLLTIIFINLGSMAQSTGKRTSKFMV
jgi:hypothetical protein